MFSEFSKGLIGQPMFQMNAEVKAAESKGEKYIHFEIGDPQFAAPRVAVNAAVAALLEGSTHYTDSSGLPALKKAVADKHNVGTDNVVIGPGCNPMIWAALACICDQGDEVCIPKYFFPSYLAIPNMLDLSISRYYFQNIEGKLTLCRMTGGIEPKVIIVNSPSNPTGEVLNQDEIDAILDYAKESNAWIICDDIYQKIQFTENKTKWFNPDMYEKLIIVNGFSKPYAMTGWRVGYAVGHKELMDKIALLFQTTISCTNTFAQKSCVPLLDHEPLEFKKYLNGLRMRRDILVSGLNEIPGIYCENPEGGLYAWADINNTMMDSTEFCDLLLDHKVIVMPGSLFGDEQLRYVRFAYCIDIEDINEGIKIMKEIIK